VYNSANTEGIELEYAESRGLADALDDAAMGSGVLTVSGLSYRYVKEEGADYGVLMNCSVEIQAKRKMALLAAIVFLVACAASIFTSVLFSRISVKPVEIAWAQQKRFVQDASHELKTPLSVILANMSIIKSLPYMPVLAVSRWIENTEQEALRMEGLVESLLFLARADDAQGPQEKVEVNFSDLAQASALSFESVAYEHNVGIDYEIADGIEVNGSYPQLARLADVLMDNAVKYSPRGSIVSVCLKARQSKAVLTVKNETKDLRQEDLSQLFDRFYRADPARAMDGYGLGLSIAKSIAESHDGTITASLDGTESYTFVTFTVTLPTVAAKATA